MSLTVVKGNGAATATATYTGTAHNKPYYEISTTGNSGYSFKGWYYSNGTLYSAIADTYFNESGNYTLTATWGIRNTYTHKINAGTGGSASSTQTVVFWDGAYSSGSDATATAVAANGYRFSGWSGDTSYATFSGDGNRTCTISKSVASNVTVTAVFVKTWTVQFYSDGRQIGDTQVVDNGGSATAPSSLSKTGYSLQGWDKDFSSVTSNLQVNAVWSANEYSVLLLQQGGSGGTSSVVATYDAAMRSITKPTRTGYTFGGYYTERNGGGTQYYTASGASARTWNIDGGDLTTLYAKWTANSYTVTLKANGNTEVWPLIDAKFPDGTANDKSFTATYGQKYPTLVGGVPSSPGYSFKNWYDGTSGTSFRDGVQLNDLTVAITANSVFYAQWTANTYTVVLKLNGGRTDLWPMLDAKWGDGTTADKSIQATYGQSYPVLSAAQVPSSRGYAFAGWYDLTKGEMITSGVQLNGQTVSVASNDVLYAQWEAQTFTVTLSGAGSVTATYGRQMPSVTPPAQAGYTFGGYYTAQNGGGVKYYNADGTSARAFDLVANTTLYQKWSQYVPLTVGTACVDSGFSFPLEGAAPLVAIGSGAASDSASSDAYVEGDVVTIRAVASARPSGGEKGVTFDSFAVSAGGNTTVYSGAQVTTDNGWKSINVIVPSGVQSFSATAYYSRDVVAASVSLGSGSADLATSDPIDISPESSTRRFGDAVTLEAAGEVSGCLFYGWGADADNPLDIASQDADYEVVLTGDMAMFAHYAKSVSVDVESLDGEGAATTGGGTVSVSVGSPVSEPGTAFLVPLGGSMRIISTASEGFSFAGMSFTPTNGTRAKTAYGPDAVISPSQNGAYTVTFQTNPPMVYLACCDVAEEDVTGNAGTTTAAYDGAEEGAFIPVEASSVTGLDTTGIPEDAHWYQVRKGLQVTILAERASETPLEWKDVEFSEIQPALSLLDANPAEESEPGIAWIDRAVTISGNMLVKTTWGLYEEPKVVLVPRAGGRAVFVGEPPLPDGGDRHEKTFEATGGVYQSTTVRAIPDPSGGYLFAGWYSGGRLVATTEDYAFEVRADITLVAAFVLDDNAVFAWEGSARNKTMTWTSGIVTVQRPTDPVAVRVDAVKYPVEVDVQTHSSPDDGNDRSHFVDVSGQAARRLPRMRPERFWQVSLMANVEIDAVVVATNVLEAN